MKAIRRFYDLLFKAEQWSGMLLLAVMTVVIVIQVFSRYILNSPLVWTEELSRFLFVWLIMLEAGHSLRTKGHIRIEAFVSILPQKVQKLLQILMDLLGLGVFAMLIPALLSYAQSQHTILFTGMKIPYSFLYGAAWIGAILLLLHLIEDLLTIILAREEGKA